ncbi:MAG: hypothetical protein AB8B73_15880 [Ekhidna sp.]
MSKIKFNWGTLIALIVSFAALITTIYEANILKSQQQALVWPYLEVEQSYTSEGFGFVAKNSGTGPAIVTSVEVTHGEEPIASFMDLLDILSPDSSVNYYENTYRALNSSVFRPGEERTIFFMEWTPNNRALLKKAKDIKITVEYKSVLDDFWVYESDKGKSSAGRFTSRLEFTTSR